MVGHGGSSAGSYLADPTSPIPSHCASIVVPSTVRVNVSARARSELTTSIRPRRLLQEYLSPLYELSHILLNFSSHCSPLPACDVILDDSQCCCRAMSEGLNHQQWGEEVLAIDLIEYFEDLLFRAFLLLGKVRQSLDPQVRIMGPETKVSELEFCIV